MTIQLVDARRTALDREWLTNVYPFYLHDLSQFDHHYYHLDAHGRWQPNHLPSWLADDTDHPLLIVAAGERVGFALVNQAPSPYMTAGTDYRMSEFFILNRFRRQGLGQQAASRLFAQFAGVWEISELPTNAPASAFWRRAISAYTGAAYHEERTPDGSLRQVFNSAVPRRP